MKQILNDFPITNQLIALSLYIQHTIFNIWKKKVRHAFYCVLKNHSVKDF